MPTSIRVDAKKSLGQNFLVNPGVVDRIIDAAGIRPGETVLEIGPGTGTLTQALVAAGATVVALEKDRRLIEPLREKFAASAAAIVEGDVLRFDPSAHGLEAGKYKIVANIPYYLTARLLRVVFEHWPVPVLVVLMVQREVADRLMASPPDMNLLALSVQLYAKPSLVMRVSRGSFRPIPAVDSAVIALEPTPEIDRHECEKVLALAKKAFAHRRKQLGSSVPAPALEKAGIKPTARPQELSPSQWQALAGTLH